MSEQKLKAFRVMDQAEITQEELESASGTLCTQVLVAG